MDQIQCEPIGLEAYRAYGDLISARSDVVPTLANMGTAQRYNWLSSLQNLRPDTAKANLCFFDSQPQIKQDQKEFEIKLLERHEFSTQVFVPTLQNPKASNYLVVVCLGGPKPDLSTLRAFVTPASVGITYHPGVWHHPLIAIEERTGFVCWVYEDQTKGDCEIFKVEATIHASDVQFGTDREFD